ncbi:D-threonate kinase [Intestinirhabdus alba]|jgi:uncharacterized protein YgbK (DUF1537 family)|uniref:Four-carbon acid sugar kinase family protein n=1 Tax=Intestinirhabdus alba TaxID=2899544 RepID=A0A6L6IJM0_9ENTR|nr:four-carbon acid sugar kinase family protein [Intestinirhabdus alba]MTH46067.1 four-carbon acid sugar kinase family protein [Intestinirhabdus alba]
MNTEQTQPEILVIADDFTGGNDAGVSLARAGLKVDVAFALPWRGDAEVLVLNSDSRAMSAQSAAGRVQALADAALDIVRPPLLLKKIDSTLRGNPGAELEALMLAAGKKRAILAPAFPLAGRTTLNGQCLVHGIPVTQTEFASDPKTPVVSADICALLRAQTAIACHPMTLSECRARLRTPAAAPEIWVVDAQSDADLDALLAAALAQEERPLLAGSAGICDALARRYASPASRRLLAVVGSMSEIAQRQIAALGDDPQITTLLIDIERALDGDAGEYVRQIAAALSAGRHCVVHTCSDVQARHRVAQLCARRGLDRPQLGEQICRYLGELTRLALAEATPGALYLSGGDVATAVAASLEATGFRITDRVAQCVPYGYFSGGSWPRPVMTKAGGFGDETTLRQVVNFIEEKMSE